MKTEDAERLRVWIHEGHLKKAELWLKDALNTCPKDDALHFWMGNLQRHSNNYPKALEHYATAMELNADSPARQAHMMLMDILCFYDKERYNV